MRLLNPESSLLHLGCGRNAPDGWLNADGSWQVLLRGTRGSKHALSNPAYSLKSQASIPWSPNVVRLDFFSGPFAISDGGFRSGLFFTYSGAPLF